MAKGFSPLIRTEKHVLRADAADRIAAALTVDAYRELTRLLAGVILVHYPDIVRAKSTCHAVETLFHVTADNPAPRYAVLDRRFRKFPSYLRRAAINAALGAVASFTSNYARWAGGQRKTPNAKPPRLGQWLKVNPPLYGGQCVAFSDDFRQVSVKLLYATDQWAWSAPMALQGRLRRLDRTGAEPLSPTLVLKGERLLLHCPVQLRRSKYSLNDVVCSVDVGINAAATLAIVDSVGTVRARLQLKSGRHNDRRDKLMAQIRSAAAQTKNLGKGFCRARYRRIAGLNRQCAIELAKAILAVARAHGATHLVFEHLKQWRPKAGKASMKVRFHRFLHRMLVQKVSWLAEEAQVKVAFVAPRGTSAWAYDGSGKVRRDKKNYSLCRFANGKRYNADYNAVSNIAARYLARMLDIVPRERPAAGTGKSSGPATRMPFVLADIWANALV